MSITAFSIRVRRRLLLLLLPLAIISLGGLQAAETANKLVVVTDRPDALYEVGQEAKFRIEVTRDGKPVSTGAVSYVVDDFITDGSSSSDYPKGELPLDAGPAVVSVSVKKPIFLRCRVTYRLQEGKALSAVAAAGFSPLEIPPSLPVPDDFDEFWVDQKRKLAEVPMDARLTPVDQADDEIECFDVQLACLGGAPVSGYLGLPKGAGPKSLPAVLWVHGAGVRSSSLGNALKGARSGMLSMDINAHGIPNGKPAAFYTELASGRLKNYRQAGRESRETVYFRGMFLRLARALEYLTHRPEWDGQVLAAIGHSQGGGQALVAGGIDQRVTLVATGVPAICDHGGRAAGRINGWPKLVPQGADGKPEAASLKTSRYVDAVNFAGRCRAEAIMSVGFIDTVCPPSSCYAAYNQLKGPKRVINEPAMGHAAPPHIHAAFFERILEHVEKSKEN